MKSFSDLLASSLACLGIGLAVSLAGAPAPGRACDDGHDAATAEAVTDDYTSHLSVDEMDRIEGHAQPRLEKILKKPVPKDLDAEPSVGAGDAGSASGNGSGTTAR